MKKVQYAIIVFIISVLMLFLVSCKNEEPNNFVGTPIVRENVSLNHNLNNSNNTINNSNNNQGQTAPAQNNTNVSGKPPTKSIKRLTVKNLNDINLKSSDFQYYAENIPTQTRNLSKQSLMVYDGYEWYLKEGHLATYNYDVDSNYNDPELTISSTVLRYETDYIDDFIAKKRFGEYKKKTFNVSVGEYSIGYYEFPPSGMYKSIYYLEFVKYDVYVSLIVASKTLTSRKTELTDYAKKIERRIVK